MSKLIKGVDIVVGLAWGDEGKGKITSYLAKSQKYDFVARWGGGNNAGHTVYKDDKKYKTHLIPSGIFYGIKSVIGPGCVLHPESFLNEVKYMDEAGFDTGLIKVDPRCHIILDEHIVYDRENLAKKLGTTSKGIAPSYSAKALRQGVLAKDILEQKYILDSELYGNILCEGAQGIWLDVNHGLYPYVTSSETLPYAACSIGFPPQKIKEIFGICKIYDTRSGVDPRFPESLLDNDVLLRLADLGQEYGVTTKRRRMVNWLNLDMLIQSINLSGTTVLIINKCDILETLGEFNLFYNDKLITFKSLAEMTEVIKNEIYNLCYLVKEIKFSYSPEIL